MNDAHFGGLLPGTEVDRYVVEGELGTGGVATVYRVRHVALQTVHALKVVHSASPTMRDRLLEEGRLQARLRHPNVVAVTDVLSVGGYPALLADFVPGGSLRALLERAPLDLKEGERLFRGVLAGVASAHDEGLAHRDLKPENVLLDDSAGPAVPRVADFGIARSMVDRRGRPRLTRTGEIMGTPSYMAPEQSRSLKNADHRSDLFSLGAVLYELVCGCRAFPRGDVLTMFRATAAGDYVPAERRRIDLPDRIGRAIDACLRPDPGLRPQSCEALLAILDGRDPSAIRRMISIRDTWDPAEIAAATSSFHDSSAAEPPPAESAVSVVALFADVRGVGHAADLVVDIAPVAGSIGPEECSAEVRSAADIAVAVGTRGLTGVRGVRWQVRGTVVRLSGESLGLALALATRALATGTRVPACWAVTGCLDLDGRVRPVEGLPAKLRAAAAAGVTDVLVPKGSGPAPAPAGLRVYDVGTFAEAARLVLGDAPPSSIAASPPARPNSPTDSVATTRQSPQGGGREKPWVAHLAATVALVAMAVALWYAL